MAKPGKPHSLNPQAQSETATLPPAAAVEAPPALNPATTPSPLPTPVPPAAIQPVPAAQAPIWAPWVDRLRQLEDPACEPMARIPRERPAAPEADRRAEIPVFPPESVHD